MKILAFDNDFQKRLHQACKTGNLSIVQYYLIETVSKSEIQNFPEILLFYWA